MIGLVRSFVLTAGAETLARTLLHSLWEGAAVAFALAIALCFLRSSRARYVAACAAMVVLLGGLVVTFTQVAPPPLARMPLAGLRFRTGVPLGDFALASSAPGRAGDELAWLAPFWFAGVLIFYLRWAMSWAAVRRLRGTGVCRAAEEWQLRLARLKAALRVMRPVVLLESGLAEVPVVAGYLRPVILMPVGLLAGLPAAQVEAILLHELAHIRRYDYVVNLMQVFVEGLLFYHPAVWWISGAIRSERENCCDDLVAEVTGGAVEYASALTALETRRTPVAISDAMAATGGNLVKRIERLLGRGERRYVAGMSVATAAMLTVGVVTAMAALYSAKPPVLLAQAAQPKPAAPARPFVGEFRLARDPDAATTPQILAQAAPDAAPARRPAAVATAVTPYTKWLREDVVYIISDAERQAFQQLTTDAEREKFIEQFWARRDPTPGTPENEFKEEHYRRIAYANEHFAADIPGWKTDRGRIYIEYGPPNEIEAHATGGAAPHTEPYQQWRYRWIEGVGQNVILEFVDTAGNGEYRLTMDPTAKNGDPTAKNAR